MDGVVYLASGSSYIREAEKSAKSVKQHNPALRTAVFSDGPVCSDTFDKVIRLERPIETMGDSLLSEKQILFDRNLYLDTDTYVSDDITSLFHILEDYDFGVAENPGAAGAGSWNKDIYRDMRMTFPTSFPEFNSGVVLYKDCDAVRELFIRWHNLYDGIDTSMVSHDTNQPALRAALYDEEINFITLRDEYNFQMNLHRCANGKIKIFHNSGDSDVDLSLFSEAANSYEGNRVITFDDYPCQLVPVGQKSRKYRVKRLLNESDRRRLIKKRIINKCHRDGIFSLFYSIIRKLYQ